MSMKTFLIPLLLLMMTAALCLMHPFYPMGTRLMMWHTTIIRSMTESVKTDRLITVGRKKRNTIGPSESTEIRKGTPLSPSGGMGTEAEMGMYSIKSPAGTETGIVVSGIGMRTGETDTALTRTGIRVLLGKVTAIVAADGTGMMTTGITGADADALLPGRYTYVGGLCLMSAKLVKLLLGSKRDRRERQASVNNSKASGMQCVQDCPHVSSSVLPVAISVISSPLENFCFRQKRNLPMHTAWYLLRSLGATTPCFWTWPLIQVRQQKKHAISWLMQFHAWGIRLIGVNLCTLMANQETAMFS